MIDLKIFIDTNLNMSVILHEFKNYISSRYLPNTEEELL